MNKHIYDFIGIEDLILEYVLGSGLKDYKNYSKKLTDAIKKAQPKNQSDIREVVYRSSSSFFIFNETTRDRFWTKFPWEEVLIGQTKTINEESKTQSSKIATKIARRRKSISQKIRLLILDRDGYRCQLCGKTAKDTQLEVDHKVAVANGGTDSLDNLWTLCIDCNRGKSDLSIKTN